MIDSSKWTGPLDEGLGRPRSGVFPAVDHGRTEAQRAATLPAELKGVVRLAALLFLLTPLALWFSWFALKAAIRDQSVYDNVHVLMLWGLSVMLVASFQMVSRSRLLRRVRLVGLSALLAATLGLAVAYLYVGLSAHSRATISAPERAFELTQLRGRNRHKHPVFIHPRADGTKIEGGSIGMPISEARVCVLVQRVQGDYGFRWIRVLDRSRAPGRGQLAWPISREECFSNEPLSSLPR